MALRRRKDEDENEDEPSFLEKAEEAAEEFEQRHAEESPAASPESGAAPPPPPAPPGQDLTPARGPHETEAEYLARIRNVPVESESPTDIVPNMPQIRPFPVEVPPPLEPPAEEESA